MDMEEGTGKAQDLGQLSELSTELSEAMVQKRKRVMTEYS